jgi:hypothetical protein
MNVEIGAEAAQYPEKEYINGIAVAVGHQPFIRTFESLSHTSILIHHRNAAFLW